MYNSYLHNVHSIKIIKGVELKYTEVNWIGQKFEITNMNGKDKGNIVSACKIWIQGTQKIQMRSYNTKGFEARCSQIQNS